MANKVNTIETKMFIGETTLWLNNQPITKDEYQAKKDAWQAQDAEYKAAHPFVHATAQADVHFDDDVQRVVAWNDDWTAKTIQNTRILAIPQGALKAMLLQSYEKSKLYTRDCRKKKADDEMKWDIFCDIFEDVKVKVTQERVPVGGTHDGGATPYSKEAFHTTIEVVEE